MKYIKITILTMLALLFAMPASAQDFVYEGITYTVLDPDAKTVKTKEGTDGENPGNAVSGDVIIPSTVSNGTETFTVVTISSCGFIGSDITSITIPETVTIVGEYAFKNCASLTSVMLSEGLEQIEIGSFQGCSGLSEILLPQSLQFIEEQAFMDCSSLEKVHLSSAVSEIENGAFQDCHKLTTINWPESLIAIYPYAFAGCNFNTLELPVSLKTLANNAFENNPISSLTLHQLLENVGDNVFKGCHIAEVNYMRYSPVYSFQLLSFEDSVYEDATLNAPNATLADIQANSPWNKFRHIVARDGKILGSGDDFEYEGLWYTVIDTGAKTVKTKEGTDGENPGNTVEGDISIPSTVSDGTNSYSVVAIGAHCFDSNQGLTSVTLPEGLTEIGEMAFISCGNLKAISFPSTLTSIGGLAFRSCTSLTEVSLPESLTELPDGLFYDCYNLTSVELPNTIRRIGVEAFTYSGALSSIKMPSSLISIANSAFYGSGLKSIDFPESFESIGQWSFFGCPLDSISLPASLKSIGTAAFGNCTGIKKIYYSTESPVELDENIFDVRAYQNASLNAPNATLSDIQNTAPWNKFEHIVAKDGKIMGAGDDFEYEGITYTVLDPDAKTVKTKDGYYDWENSISGPGNNVEGELVLPAKVSDGVNEYSVVEIGSRGFEGCNISTLVLPETIVSIGDDGFINCEKLDSVSLPSSLISIGEHTFYHCRSLTSIFLPDNLESIGRGAFAQNSSLQSITLPESLESIGSFVFDQCEALEKVILPANMPSSENAVFNNKAIKEVTYLASIPVASAENLFNGLDTYQNATLYMPNAILADALAVVPWNKFTHIVAKDGEKHCADGDLEYEGLWYTIIDEETKTVKTKDGKMDNSNSIATPGNNAEGNLVIPSTVSDGTGEYTVVEIGQYGFHGTGIVSLTLPETVTSIGKWAFEDCEQLASLSLPETLRSIQQDAFDGCSSLTSVHLPDGLTFLGHGVFQTCDNLSEINIPTSLKEIGVAAFNLCGITSLVIPENVEVIGESSFNQNQKLASLTLPSSLTSIGGRAFYAYLGDLKEVTYNASVPLEVTANDIFSETNYETATLYMPNASLADIQSTTPWNKFEHVVAKDGSATLANGDDFEFEGLWYTVIDAEAKTVKTRDYYYDQEQNKWIVGNNVEGAIIIPETVSAGGNDYTVIEIGDRGFYESKITSVTLPPSIIKIDDIAFSHCNMLESINLPESLESIGSQALFGTAIKGIIIPEKITEISDGIFWDCVNIESVKLHDNLKIINKNAFYDCSSLKSMDLPSSLRRIEDSAFSFSGITSIILPEGLEYLGSSFTGTPLETVSIPGSLIETAEKTFDCIRIETVNYEAATPVALVESLFGEDVYNKATLNAPNATLADIQATIPWNKFAHIVAKDGSVSPALAAGEDFEYDGIIYTVVDSELMTVKTKEGEYHQDHYEAGNGCKGELSIPSSVFNNGYEYNVTEIGQYGFFATQITSVVLPESLISIGDYAFRESSELTSINLSKKLKKIGAYAFSDCSKLESVILPDSLEVLSAGALRLTAIREIVIPDKINCILSGVFGGCRELTNVVFPDSLKSIETMAFMNCNSLSEISLPGSLKRIESHAFFDCKLQSIDLPEGLDYIGDYSFDQNPLENVSIPSSMSEFGERPFFSCWHILEVNYSGIIPVALDESLFGEYIYNNATLNAPNATLADIQATIPWNKFLHIIANDGTVGMGPSVGEEIEVDGMIFEVTNEENRTLKMQDGNPADGELGNSAEGDYVIPSVVSTANGDYTVTEIGSYAFWSNADLLSVTIPATVTSFGTGIFADCVRLTSIIWQGHNPLPYEVVSSAGNPNILLYVDDPAYAPVDMNQNVVAGGVCDIIELQSGYPFFPAMPFTADRCQMSKSFTQQTPSEGCAGWETLTLPFEPNAIVAYDGRGLAPFDAFVEDDTRCPFWLYEADSNGEWKSAATIRQGVPYLVSMPNNDNYDEEYRINGFVTFSTDQPTYISSEVTSPYETAWNSGREFSSIWLPLHEDEESMAMGLNSGIDYLYDDEGILLAPGSAFHVRVAPRPLEAFVTRIDSRRAMPVRGGQSFVKMMSADDRLRIAVDTGSIAIASDSDRAVDVLTIDGVILRRVELKAGEICRIDNLTRGIYIVAGRKITVN